MISQLRLPIGEASAAAEARRTVTALARTLGFDENANGRVAIVVTEAATNLFKHAIDGQLLVRAFERDEVTVIEALALDQGPGIVNVNECLRDGHSTAGSTGSGLGAMMRLSDEFDLHSTPGKGTALVVRLYSRKINAVNQLRLPEMGVVCLPKTGESECGDAWAVERKNERILILVADGLGHGPAAAAASMEAVKALQSHSHLSPGALIEFAHGALRSTRGAAVAIAELDLTSEVRYAGIGNITGVTLATNGARHLVSHNGIVGHEMRTVQEFVYPWTPESMLVMHSDGLTTHWNLDHYPGLANRHPSLIAGVLYRDFTRGRDDITVVVVKQQ